MTHAVQYHLSEIHVMTVGLQTATANLIHDFAAKPEGAPLEELTELDSALDAVGIAAGRLERVLATRETRLQANRRAARVALAECRLRLEMLYAARPTPELEAALVAVSTLPAETDGLE